MRAQRSESDQERPTSSTWGRFAVRMPRVGTRTCAHPTERRRSCCCPGAESEQLPGRRSIPIRDVVGETSAGPCPFRCRPVCGGNRSPVDNGRGFRVVAGRCAEMDQSHSPLLLRLHCLSDERATTITCESASRRVTGSSALHGCPPGRSRTPLFAERPAAGAVGPERGTAALACFRT
jgi:hypothetical protein